MGKCVFLCEVETSYTLSLHAHCQTLLEAAVWTTLPLGKVHGAALLFCTGVMLVILYCAFKEALRREKQNNYKTVVLICKDSSDYIIIEKDIYYMPRFLGRPRVL